MKFEKKTFDNFGQSVYHQFIAACIFRSDSLSMSGGPSGVGQRPLSMGSGPSSVGERPGGVSPGGLGGGER